MISRAHKVCAINLRLFEVLRRRQLPLPQLALGVARRAAAHKTPQSNCLKHASVRLVEGNPGHGKEKTAVQNSKNSTVPVNRAQTFPEEEISRLVDRMQAGRYEDQRAPLNRKQSTN